MGGGGVYRVGLFSCFSISAVVEVTLTNSSTAFPLVDSIIKWFYDFSLISKKKIANNGKKFSQRKCSIFFIAV